MITASGFNGTQRLREAGVMKADDRKLVISFNYKDAQGSKLIPELVAKGVIPEGCYDFSVAIADDEVVKMTATAWLAKDKFQALVESMVDNPRESIQFSTYERIP